MNWDSSSHSQSAGWNGTGHSQAAGWNGNSHSQDPYGAYAQPLELEEEEDDADEEAGDTFMVSSSGLWWQLDWPAHTCSPAAVTCCGHLLIDWQATCGQQIAFLVAVCCWAANVVKVLGCSQQERIPSRVLGCTCTLLPKHAVSSATQPW